MACKHWGRMADSPEFQARQQLFLERHEVPWEVDNTALVEMLLALLAVLGSTVVAVEVVD